jgi:hypothetical protein
LDKLDPRSGERAIWELFQNARDLAKKNANGEKEAHIKLTLTPTEFIFAHQGKPFTHDSFGSLVKQVSSQCKEDEESVGQYGTGFLTTHAFGRKILVNGSLYMEELAPGKYVDINNFVIDRTFDDITEFVDKMAKQLVNIENMADAPMVETCREWTEFHYQLDSADNALSKVVKAFESAIKVMPYVLTTNTSIVDVTIEDEVNGRRISFVKEVMPEEDGLLVMGIRITENGSTRWQKVYYLQSEDKLDTVIMPLSSPTQAHSLDGIAKLFVYFPLLGTEDFGMDFVFHSHRFYPVEERDALHLPVENANVKSKYEANVAVLNSMSDMVFAYLREHSENISRMVDIMQLNFECMRNKEDVTNDFFKRFKEKWVNFYVTLPVFQIKGAPYSLASGKVDVFVPSIVESFEDEQESLFDDVYASVEPHTNLPAQDVVLAWSKVVHSWKDASSSCFLNMLKLAKVVSENPNFATLHSFDVYIKEMGEAKLFDEYALIPNRDNILRKKVYLQNAEAIPTWLSEIVRPLVPDTVATLVNPGFVDVDTLTTFTRKDLSEKITSALRSLREQYLKHNKCYEREMIETLVKISSIYKSEGAKFYRSCAMPVICNHLGLSYEEKVLSPLDSDERDIAQLPFQHLVENMLLEISCQDAAWMETNANYVFELHSALSAWSEYYNRNDKKGLATTYGAYPNRVNQPNTVSSLKYCLDDLTELKPLYKAVLNVDIDEVLVNEEYQDFCEFTKITADEIAGEIEAKLAEDEFTSEFVLDIINHLDDEQWQKWFPRIQEKKAELFLKQVKAECQDSIFRLMKVNDPSKLNQLADLADDVDLDEIIRIGKKSLVEKRNQEAEFEYKKSLGEYVEDRLQTALAQRLQYTLNAGAESAISVENEQYGHDLVVYCHNEPVYYLEVKSRWGSDQSVMMSPLQMATSVKEASQYALCCVDMTGEHISEDEYHNYPEIAETIARIKSLTNIGELNSEVIKSTGCIYQLKSRPVY